MFTWRSNFVQKIIPIIEEFYHFTFLGRMLEFFHGVEKTLMVTRLEGYRFTNTGGIENEKTGS